MDETKNIQPLGEAWMLKVPARAVIKTAFSGKCNSFGLSASSAPSVQAGPEDGLTAIRHL
jgi:hypothetical protein